MKEAWLESEPEVINLESLKARFLGNINLLERILSTFTGQLDADLEELEQAILAGNSEAAAELSHRIKGMSASVEAKCLFKNASIAEQRARENCLAELPDSLNRMQTDRSRLSEVLRARRQDGRGSLAAPTR